MELKQPMSYEEQLNELIEQGIVVDDKDRAIDILKRVITIDLLDIGYLF